VRPVHAPHRDYGKPADFRHRREDGTPVVGAFVVADAFRRIVKDYFQICDSYYQAIRTATTDKIEAIDRAAGHP